MAIAALGGFAFLSSAWAGQAPSLENLVTTGRLPKLEDRLPKNPVVVQPVERVGKYGGTWRTAVVGGADHAYLSRTIGYENLVRWDPENARILPNVAESFTVNPEATEFTFKLREGLRWSDGQPFTVDDILFWYEDVLLDRDLTKSPPAWMNSGGLGTVTKVDNYTVKFAFKEPHGLFLQLLASWRGDAPVLFAKHYFRQFHKKYNPDRIQDLVREANVPDWAALFQAKGGVQADTIAHWQTTAAPRLYGWILTQPYGFGNRVVAERNPYYFKVDTAGNQLPYIDRVTYEVLQDPQVFLAKAIAGEIDMADRHIFNTTNRPVLAEYRQRAGYRFLEQFFTKMNTAVFSFNLTTTDPVKREIFRNKDFRIGLSHAINRKEIIDLIFIGEGEAWQAAPPRETSFFHERLAKQYTNYDVVLATRHLDRAFPRRDPQNFRLGPDGKRISVTVELPAAFIPELVDIAEVIKRHWAAVGVELQVRAIDRSLYHTRELANQQEAAMWWGDGGFDTIMDPRFYFPYNRFSSWAPAWAKWSEGTSGGTVPLPANLAGAEAPPPSTEKQMRLYRQLTQTGDLNSQYRLLREILDIAADEFYVIGISTTPEGYSMAKNEFRNVPARMQQGGAYFLTPAPTNPSQYFWDR